MKLPNVSPHPYTDLAHEGFYYAKLMAKRMIIIIAFMKHFPRRSKYWRNRSVDSTC